MTLALRPALGDLPADTTGALGTPRVGALAREGTASTTLAVPYPASVAVGELLIITMGIRTDAAADAEQAVTGWQRITAHSGINSRETVFYRIATAADVGVTSVTVTGPAVLRSAKMIAVPGADLTNPIPTFSKWEVADSNTTAAVMPALTPPVVGCMPIWMASGFQGNTTTWTPTPSAGTTEWLDTWQESTASSTVGRSASAYYQAPLTTTSSTGTRTATPSVAATNAGVFLLVQPSQGAPPVDVELGGDGTLTATVTARLERTALLTGSGALTRAASSSLTQGAALASNGQLSATVSMALTVTANPTGSGTLTATGTPSRSGTLTGSGQLSATASIALSASLSATGQLSAVGRPELARSASSNGSGQLSATFAPSVSVVLTGAGQLTAVTIPRLTRVAALAGSGQLTASRLGRVITSAAFTAAGRLTAVFYRLLEQVLAEQGASFNDEGELIATWTVEGIALAEFSDDGLATALFDSQATAVFQVDGVGAGIFETDGVASTDFAADGVGEASYV